MHQDKLNHILRDKLSTVNELPQGISYNQQGIWDKLEDRLTEKKGKKLKWWYYAAAVLLLAASMILFMKSGNGVGNKTMALQKIPGAEVIRAVDEKAPDGKVATSQGEKTIKNIDIQKAISPEQPLARALPRKKDKIQSSPVVPVPVVEHQPVFVVENEQTPEAITSVVSHNEVFSARKCKFKVVHINEEEADMLPANVAVESVPEKQPFFNFTLRSQYKTDASLINSSPKKEGGLFKAAIN